MELQVVHQLQHRCSTWGKWGKYVGPVAPTSISDGQAFFLPIAAHRRSKVVTNCKPMLHTIANFVLPDRVSLSSTMQSVGSVLSDQSRIEAIKCQRRRLSAPYSQIAHHQVAPNSEELPTQTESPTQIDSSSTVVSIDQKAKGSKQMATASQSSGGLLQKNGQSKELPPALSQLLEFPLPTFEDVSLAMYRTRSRKCAGI
jgi:hypothetical protein